MTTIQHQGATFSRPSKTNSVTNKFEMGNCKAAIIILCSEEKLASFNEGTLKALQKNHPEPPADRRPFCDPKGNLWFHPLQVSAKKIKKVLQTLQTFPFSSMGGPDGLTSQHLKELLAETPDSKLFSSMTQLINLILAGSYPIAINEIIFGGPWEEDGGVTDCHWIRD